MFEEFSREQYPLEALLPNYKYVSNVPMHNTRLSRDETEILVSECNIAERLVLKLHLYEAMSF